MRHVYWLGGRVRQMPSPYGVRGETGYTAQENLKSISSDTMGEGGRSGSGSPFLTSLPPWFSLLFRPWVSTFLPLFIFRANSLALVDSLLMSNYLPISLLTHLGIQFQGKWSNDCSGFFRLSRGAMGLWVPFAYSAREHL